MFSQAVSCSFPLQVVEELVHAGPSLRVAAILAAPPKSLDGVAATIDEMSLGKSRSTIPQLRVLNASVEAALALASRSPHSRIAIACADASSARISAAIATASQVPSSMDSVAVDAGLENYISASSRLVFTTAEALHLRLLSPHNELVFDYVILGGLWCDDVCTKPLMSLLTRENAPPCVAIASCSAELPLPFKQLQSFEIPPEVCCRVSLEDVPIASADVPDTIIAFHISNPGACIAVFTAEPLLKLLSDIRARARACNATLPDIKLLHPSLTARQLATL